MATRKSTSKTTPTTPAKMIPAVVVLSEVTDRFKKIEKHCHGADCLLAAIEEDQDWAIAISYVVTGIRDEVKEIREYLDKMVISGKTGAALGIEKGGVH